MNPNPETLDYDLVLRTNLADVFGERDAARRLQAIEALDAPDATLIDPEGAVRGHAAISAQVEALHARLPADFAFAPTGPAIGDHDAGRLFWRGGPPEAPSQLTGTDVALFEGGLIKTLYAFVDPFPTDTP